LPALSHAKAWVRQARQKEIRLQRKPHNNRVRDLNSRLRLTDRLVYLPGALVMAYGFWLTLTT